MKKGFTLIELLAVIVILAIILLIAVPQVMSAIESARIGSLTSNLSMVKEATKNYLISNNVSTPSSVGETIEIPIITLENDGYISDLNNTDGACSGYVLVTKIDDNNFNYNPELKCGDSNGIDNVSEDNLLGYWKLDNKTQLLDLSGKDNIAVSYGGLEIGSEDNATYFDGVDDYIDVSSIADDFVNSSITVCASINAGYLDHRSVLSINTAAGANTILFMPRTGKIGINTGPWFISEKNVTDSNWHNVCYTYNDSTSEMIVYADGEVVLEYNDSVVISNTDIFSIGMELDSTTPTDFFQGKIKEVKVYNRALSSEEIKYQYDVLKNQYN